MRTGVTAVVPHDGNLFRSKVAAAVFPGNAFGKAAGFLQVAELGTLETPIVLTNTLCVGTAVQAVVDWTLRQPGNEEVESVNAVVGEVDLTPNRADCLSIRGIARSEADLVVNVVDAANLERSGRAVPDSLHQDIRSAKQQIVDNEAYILEQQQGQQVIRARFEADIQRFRELQAEIEREKEKAQQQGGAPEARAAVIR